MDDLQNVLRDVWDWLPVFRIVAETEHLPTAAKRLHRTRAAISRTINVLEDRLDRELFNRSGRRLVLNESGERLLRRLREGMSDVEAGLRAALEEPYSGTLRLSSVGVLTNHFVVPVMLELKDEYPDLEPVLRNLRPTEAAEALLQGELDVAFFYESMTFEGLHVDKLGTTTSSIYCGRGHPLFDRESVELDELLEHPFSVPGLGDTGKVMDDWPTDQPREIGMRIMLLESNVRICRSGQFVTVLPDIAALEWVKREEIRRFDHDLLPPTPLYAARRERQDAFGRAATVIDMMRARIEVVTSEIDAMRRGDGENASDDL